MTEIKNPFLNLESSFSAPFCSVGRASGLDNKNYKLPTPTLRRLITDFVISVCVVVMTVFRFRSALKIEL